MPLSWINKITWGRLDLSLNIYIFKYIHTCTCIIGFVVYCDLSCKILLLCVKIHTYLPSLNNIQQDVYCRKWCMDALKTSSFTCNLHTEQELWIQTCRTRVRNFQVCKQNKVYHVCAVCTRNVCNVLSEVNNQDLCTNNAGVCSSFRTSAVVCPCWLFWKPVLKPTSKNGRLSVNLHSIFRPIFLINTCHSICLN